MFRRDGTSTSGSQYVPAIVYLPDTILVNEKLIRPPVRLSKLLALVEAGSCYILLVSKWNDDGSRLLVEFAKV